ncbi:hypothetical protein [Riemerella anatipestifer]|uniref:hypothetical protein n=1 Tax=Riemerella anatipestifer TaxID=34085 RepID=UPI0015E7C685|nr:hypothetical protein [Riemerella anatipestifer]
MKNPIHRIFCIRTKVIRSYEDLSKSTKQESYLFFGKLLKTTTRRATRAEIMKSFNSL